MNRITAPQAWDAIEAMLHRLRNPETRTAYLDFHQKHRELALTTPAAVRKHHGFPGGYGIHIREVMSNLREMVSTQAILMHMDLGFTADDAITASYVHDLDKLLYRYELDVDPPSEAQAKYARSLGVQVTHEDTKASISLKIDAAKNGTPPPDESRLPRHRYREAALEFEDGAIVAHLCREHGLPISLMALHAVCFHHGGWSPGARTMNHLEMKPLAVLLHCADLISASAQKGDGHWSPPTLPSGALAGEPASPAGSHREDPAAPPPPPED